MPWIRTDRTAAPALAAGLLLALVGGGAVVAHATTASTRAVALDGGAPRPQRAGATRPAGARQAARPARLAGAPRLGQENAAVPARSGDATDPTLERHLEAKMSRSTAGRYGIVVDIAGVGRVASIQPQGAMRPASTQKLFTTLPLLLDRPRARLVTTITARSTPVHGVLHGSLVVHATADPSLLKHHLVDLGRQLRAAGIRRVTGRLRLDIGSLPTRTRRDGWKADFVPTDVGPLSPFPVYEDVWRHDSAYLAHPTRANLALLRTKLEAAGVHIDGGDDVFRGSGSGGTVVASHSSRQLRTLVAHTLRVSDNFYAEQLLVVAGGRHRVDQLVTAAGITDESKATDGSGLSYYDRETPRGEVMLLDYAHGTPAYADLRASLPVGCRSGTLEHRFCHTAGAGTVYAKTGTLDHTTALTGWTIDGRHRLVTFSIITARVHDLTAAMRATDRAVLVLRNYTG